MTRQHIHALAKHPKLKGYLQSGVCIGERKIVTTPVLLFQVSSYYIEVFFTEDESEVVSTRTFSEVEELEPYLKGIDIAALFF